MMAKTFFQDQLEVSVFGNRVTMGYHAAEEAASVIRTLLAGQRYLNMLFAAAPSQSEFLEKLARFEEIDWSRIRAFHLDEYVGLEVGRPERFGSFLRHHVFDRVPFLEVYYIDDGNLGSEAVVARYARLLKEYPIDVACIGIGENGHIAFNDPHAADFADRHNFKIVDLDDRCRRQQVNDGCFPHVEAVPKQAYTVTVPAIMSARYVFCMVPGKSKEEAVRRTLLGPIEPACPASVLRSHQRAKLYLDRDSASLIADVYSGRGQYVARRVVKEQHR